MKFSLTNLNQNDIDKLEKSGINWYPDDLSDESPEYMVVFESEEDREKAIKFLGIKNHSGYLPSWL